MTRAYWIRISAHPGQSQNTTGSKAVYDIALLEEAPNGGSLPLAEAQCTNLWDMTKRARDEAEASRDPYVTYGNRLAEWLFCKQNDREKPNPIGQALKDAKRELKDGERLRLLVSVEPKLLREDPPVREATFFQSLTGAENFRVEAVRTVWDESNDAQLANKHQKRPVAEKLRILAVLANPDDIEENRQKKCEHLPGLEDEFHALMVELLPLRDYKDAPIVVEHLWQPCPDDLDRAIQDTNPHVMVFLGHGQGLRTDSPEGGLVCVDGGKATLYGYARLQSLLRSIPGGADLRLAVLLACQSFVAAPGLLVHGVPAVVGMQPYRHEDFRHGGAKPFAEPFFRSLAEFRPVGQALQRGVAGLRDVTWQEQVMQEAQKDPQANQTSLDWTRHVLRATSVMPTLWLAGTDDRLFAETEARQRASYKKKLSEQLEMEWSGPQGHVALDAVFVAPPCRDRTSHQPILIPDEIARNHAVAILGDEWSGKTALAHWTVLNAFATGGKTPVLVPAREIKDDQHLDQWLKETCLRRLGLNAPEEMTNFIMEDCRNGAAVIVIDDVEGAWLAQHPDMLRQRLFGHGRFTAIPLVVTTAIGEHPFHPDWKGLVIQRLTVEQQVQVVEAYGRAAGAEQATEEVVEWLTQPEKHATGITALAERSGYLVFMLRLYLQRKVLLKEETDLLETIQHHRWQKKVRKHVTLTLPDEPVYKQQILEALGFHLYFCRRGRASGAAVEQMLRLVLEQLDGGEGPIYSSDMAPAMLEEYTDIRHFLRGNRQDGWVFRSPEWLRFYAASQVAALVNGQDKALVGWIKGTTSLQCQSCGVPLGRWEEQIPQDQGHRVRAAVKTARKEVLPAWKRTDPWNCSGVRELRRMLVRTLPLR